MTRVRQALRCAARRTDGQPCEGWAVVGATVCRAHGGSAPQVRAAAVRRVTEADIRRAFNTAYDRWLVEYREWQVQRVATAAVLLGMEPRDFMMRGGGVNEMLLAWCRLRHGRPDGRESAPKLRVDRRFRGARLPVRDGETP